MSNLPIEELLQVDVDAEIRKLASTRLRGHWELAIELVRRSIHRGAARVDVKLGAHGMTVYDDGDPIPADTLAALATLQNTSASKPARHDALVQLETAGERGLIATLGVGASRVRIESGSVAHGADEAFQIVPAADAAVGTRVDVWVKLDASVARLRLAAACAFAPVEIVIDGRSVPKGFDTAMATARAMHPVPAGIAIRPEGEGGRVRLLIDGVVSAHEALVDPPWFDAAVELGALAPPNATAADLRALLAEYFPEIQDAAVRLALVRAEAFASLGSKEQARIRELLLAAAVRGLRPGEVETVRIFPALVGVDRVRHGKSLADLARLGDGGRAIWALHPDQDPQAFLHHEGPVLLLDDRERSLLSEHFGLRFVTPSPRRTERSAWGRARMRARSALDRLRERVRHPMAGAVVEETHLSGLERVFLREVWPYLCTGVGPYEEVQLAQGGGPVRSRAETLVLPRENALVRAAMSAVGADPGWVWPVCLSLCGPGRTLPNVPLEQWRSRPA